MGDELRVAFHRQLEEIDQALVRLFATVTEGVAAATDAFLSSDRTTARILAEREVQVNAVRGELELTVSSILALQSPVASELRFLLAALRLVPELERSHDLAEHIANRAGQSLAADFSPRARGLVAQMGELATDMWRSTADAYLERSAVAAERLPSLDDHLDEMHGRLTAELASGSMTLPVAMEGILVARFYERLGDHAVNTSRRIAYLAGLPASDRAAPDAAAS